MAKYVSIVERRIATTKGVTYVFQPMVPLEIHPDIEEDVIAAGLVREDIFEAAMAGRTIPTPEVAAEASFEQALETETRLLDIPDEDNFDTVLAEMKAEQAEREARTAAIAQAELEAELERTADEEAEASRIERGTTKEEDHAFLAGEKSPEFNQAVFETAVREIIAKNDPATLTPKGAPKARALSDLVGFEVKAIQITNFLKHLE